jgi:hypothetical protein
MVPPWNRLTRLFSKSGPPQREVALEVAHVHPVGLGAHRGPEAHLGPGERDRVARREPVGRAQRAVVGGDLGVQDEEVGQVRGLDVEDDGPRVSEEVAVPVLEGGAHALAGREAAPQLGVLHDLLDDVDDHRLAGRGDERLGQGDLDAREDAEGRQALLGLADVARAVGLQHLERDATADDALARVREPVNDDVADDDLIALDDVEADARPRVVERRLERVLDVDVRVAELLVPVDDAAPGVVELRGAHELAHRHLRRRGHVGLARRVQPGERDVPQLRAWPELHRDAHLHLGRALHAAARIGPARERGVDGRDRQGQPRGIVGADLRRQGRHRKRDAPVRRRVRIAPRPQHLHRAHLRVQEALVAIQLLHVLGRAVVGVGDEGRVGLELERLGARAPRGRRPLGAQGRAHAARIGVDEQLGARQLLLEEALDLGADLRRRARAAARQLAHGVELEAGVPP